MTYSGVISLHPHRDQVIGIGVHALRMQFLDIFRGDVLNLHGDQFVDRQIGKARGLHAVDVGGS